MRPTPAAVNRIEGAITILGRAASADSFARMNVTPQFFVQPGRPAYPKTGRYIDQGADKRGCSRTMPNPFPQAPTLLYVRLPNAADANGVPNELQGGVSSAIVVPGGKG